jgi:hypothetical protein
MQVDVITYSNQELANMNFMYGLADGNAVVVHRLYQERYPGQKCPHRKTFVRFHRHLCEQRNFEPHAANKRQPRSMTPEVEDILDIVD